MSDAGPAVFGGGLGGPAVSMEAMRQNFVGFLDAEYLLVVRFVIRDGACLAEAEDAAQEAFTRAWLKVLGGRWPQVAHPRAWIRTVALNHHRTQMRNRASVDLTPERAEPGPGHAELTGQAMDVLAALRLVEDENARAVLALDLDGIPGPAIAETLGLTEQQVRDLRKKARRSLKQRLRNRPAGVEGRSGR